jgi:hypothetical protein
MMERKKVKTDTIKTDDVKKRDEIVEEKKTIITSVSNDSKVKWDKIKGINNKIIRFKVGDVTRKEELSKKKYRQLYVGVDGNDLYFYYEIIE